MDDGGKFDEIKARFSEGWPNANRRLADIGWLVAEVERLRADRASYITDAAVALDEMRNGVAAEVGVLREALQAAESELEAAIVDLKTLRKERDAAREALTALLAATEFMAGEGSGVMTQAIIERFDAARAAAAAVLGTGANLGDSGMSQPGGVSDGPQ